MGLLPTLKPALKCGPLLPASCPLRPGNPKLRLEVEVEVEEGCPLHPIESLALDSHRLQVFLSLFAQFGLEIPPLT